MAGAVFSCFAAVTGKQQYKDGIKYVCQNKAPWGWDGSGEYYDGITFPTGTYTYTFTINVPTHRVYIAGAQIYYNDSNPTTKVVFTKAIDTTYSGNEDVKTVTLDAGDWGGERITISYKDGGGWQ